MFRSVRLTPNPNSGRVSGSGSLRHAAGSNLLLQLAPGRAQKAVLRGDICRVEGHSETLSGGVRRVLQTTRAGQSQG